MSVEDAKQARDRALQAARETAAELTSRAVQTWPEWARKKVREVIKGQASVANALNEDQLRDLKASVEAAISAGTNSADECFARVRDVESIARSNAGPYQQIFAAKAALTVPLWKALDATGFRLYPGSQNWGNLDRFDGTEIELGEEFDDTAQDLRNRLLELAKADTQLENAVRDDAQSRALDAWDNLE